MKPRYVLMLLAVAIFAPREFARPVLGAESKQPNIVFVLFDDLGYGEPRCYRESSEFAMPNLARLALEGMRFTDAHSASAVCTPTRYGVLTGRYPSRIGQYGVLTTYSPPIIPKSRLTVASLLKGRGYHTACVGKWHLGVNWVDGKPGTEAKVPIGSRLSDGPNALGFDYFCGFTHARNIGTIIEQDRVVEHVAPVENQPLMLRKALAYLEKRAREGGPFFLYFPMGTPHTPVVPAPGFVGKSGARDLVGHDPKYGDWVHQGDAMLGAILETLERLGLAANTLVIATSDNGAEHRAYPPLRDSKRSIHEGGHRVPFVARWPGKVAPGTACRQTVCLNDLMATAAEITGAALPDGAGEDSFSLLPALLGQPAGSSRETTVHQSMTGDLAIREGAWKLIFLKNGQRALHNLEADLGESENVAEAHPAVVARLARRMRSTIDQGRSTPGSPQTNDVPIPFETTEPVGKPSQPH